MRVCYFLKAFILPAVHPLFYHLPILCPSLLCLFSNRRSWLICYGCKIDVGNEDVGNEDVGNEDVGNEDVGNEDVGNEDVGNEDVGNEDVGND
jgi:hypothetical protein